MPERLTNLDFTEARDSEWQWHQLGRMQVCTSLQTDNHTSTLPLKFLQAGCPSCRPTNSVKELKAFKKLRSSSWQFQTVTVSECCLMKLLAFISFEKFVCFSIVSGQPRKPALFSCSGTLSFHDRADAVLYETGHTG